MEYHDYLKEHMTVLARRRVEEFALENLPSEFAGIEPDKLIYMIADQAVPILRKMEDDAIYAAVEKVAALIRYSKKTK